MDVRLVEFEDAYVPWPELELLLLLILLLQRYVLAIRDGTDTDELFEDEDESLKFLFTIWDSELKEPLDEHELW